ncbi:ATP-dependent nuclease [Escherichia coli]
MEGETETWVINELARQCGHHFDAEGIKVIEFAQSGLKPLVKFARRMGIEWHVLVDGDEAGKKYAATVRSLLNNDWEAEREHLTALPALDMEHFMYRGFSECVPPRGANPGKCTDESAQNYLESDPSLFQTRSCH